MSDDRERQDGKEHIPDAEILSETQNARPAGALVEMRRPSVPATLDQIASLGDEGVSIVRARHQVLKTIREATIQLTYPQDWLFFKDTEGRIVGYLQDSGCDRATSLWGISVFNVSQPEKIAGEDGSFVYAIRGDGRCAITGLTIESAEGMRSSDERIAKEYTNAAQKEWVVRKAARANLDGTIFRELTGFKSVPLDELIKADPSKKWLELGSKGKGFGTQGQRQAVRENEATEVPACPKCGGPMYDNRGRKTSERAPDFTCQQKNGPCGEKKGDRFNKTAVWLDSKDKNAAPAAPAKGAATAGQGGPSGGAAPQGRGPQAGAAPFDQPAQAAGAAPAPAASEPEPISDDEKAEMKTRRTRLIKAQFKGRKLSDAQQYEVLEPYYDTLGFETDDERKIENLPLEMLDEIYEEMKKPRQQ